MAISKFLTGVITGIVAGVLFAPDKGSVTREKMAAMTGKCKLHLDKLTGNAPDGLEELRYYLSCPVAGLKDEDRIRILTILDEAGGNS